MKNALLSIFISTALIFIVGCSGMKAAYTSASGIEQKAKVVAEAYYAVVMEARLLKEQGVLSGAKLLQVENLVKNTHPLIVELGDTAKSFAAVKSAENESELQDAITRAAMAVSDMIDAIKAIKPTVSIKIGGFRYGCIANSAYRFA